ncbi:MAG TPA: Lrp/AsnC family transcriptional regulator [Phycisphaerae bacterium]|nr:Lrp/AsnC family transcriptional regulator [Phycisphaerae bacterium]
MDTIDLRIALALADNGRMPNSEIARRLGVSEGTVRQRLRRLIGAGALKVQAMVNADQAPNQYMAVIGLSLEGRQLEKCAAQINRFPEVQRTLIVTGRFDILVSLLLDGHDRLVDFVTHKLSKVPGIRDSETFVCLKDYEPWFPAACLARPRADRTVGRRTSRKRKRE